MSLSPSECERYDRQMLMTDWGVEGQRKLKGATVVVAGLGGLGCPGSLYLAAAGIGRILLIDKEKYQLSDLNRQILCGSQDLGQFKAKVAKTKLEALNSEITVNAKIAEIRESNVSDLMKGADIVIDGMDNWRSRFIINEQCVVQGTPLFMPESQSFMGRSSASYPGRGHVSDAYFPRHPQKARKFPC